MDGKKRSFIRGTSRVALRGLTPDGRLAAIGRENDGPPDGDAEVRIENAVGSFPVPFGIATNFIVNHEERLVAMATEERSVIAASSYAAKLCRETGGFTVQVGPNVAAGQVLFSRLPSRIEARVVVAEIKRKRRSFEHALATENPMRKYGGEVVRVHAEEITHDAHDPMVAVTIEVGVGDAMGANVVTRLGERLAALCEPIAGKRRTAVICTNRNQGPSVSARARWSRAMLGEDLVERIIDLQAWAERDAARAVTHNKGVMNGISAVALAAGQDVRAVEASAHALAAETNRSTARYAPLTAYRIDREWLEGRLFLHLPLGTIGGATSMPAAIWARELMGAHDVRALAAICGAAGLAQNFAALRSLADEGIPEAHARLRR